MHCCTKLMGLSHLIQQFHHLAEVPTLVSGCKFSQSNVFLSRDQNVVQKDLCKVLDVVLHHILSG